MLEACMSLLLRRRGIGVHVDALDGAIVIPPHCVDAAALQDPPPLPRHDERVVLERTRFQLKTH